MKDGAILVALVEDDDLIRESLAVLINGAAGFQCIYTCATAEEALQFLTNQRPDVVLMDIQLPGISGVDCVRQMKNILPGTQFVMLTMHEDDQLLFDSLIAGASGYLLKRTPHVQILQAIEDVQKGGSPMTSSIARKVVQSFQFPGAANESGESASRVPLPVSPRENEVLQLLSKGYRYKEIADRLGIATETVRTHLRRIYEKLQVTSRTEAVVKYLQRGQVESSKSPRYGI